MSKFPLLALLICNHANNCQAKGQEKAKAWPWCNFLCFPTDPVSMVSVDAAVLALLLVFLLLIISLLIAYKKQKICFKGIYLIQNTAVVVIVFYLNTKSCFDYLVGTTIIYPIHG